ncbi:MAG: GntR family transcriptional regulator [Victivallales bacterium]
MKRPVQKNNLGERTEFVKRAIVRHVLEKGLKTGDKLPTQSELRHKLQVGNATIIRAIQSLESEHVLEIRPKIGVFLKNSVADGHKGWTIGIAAQEFAGHPFVGLLLLYIERCLHEYGCQPLIFYGEETFQRTDFELEWFPGLRRCASAHLIDGLITTLEFTGEGWDFLRENRIPASFFGPVDVPCSTVFYDIPAFAKEATEKMLMKGYRRPAMLSVCGIVRNYLFPVFTEMTGKLSGFDAEKYYFDGLTQHETGKMIASRLLDMPPQERPDFIVSIDDNITTGMVNALIEKQWNHVTYAPQIVALCTRQLPLILPWPDIEYLEIDIEVIAKKTVELCLKQLKEPDTEKEAVLFKAQKRRDKI